MSVISKLAVHLTIWTEKILDILVVTFFSRLVRSIVLALTDPDPTDSDHAKCGGVLRPNEKLIEMIILGYL